MRKFMVCCLTTVGAVTMLSMVAAAGAAGLYYWQGEEGCTALPQQVRVVTEKDGKTAVYDFSPKVQAAKAPAAAPVAEASPTNAELLELKARLAAALQRIAELEDERRPAPEAPAPPATPTPADPGKTADF